MGRRDRFFVFKTGAFLQCGREDGKRKSLVKYSNEILLTRPRVDAKIRSEF